MLGGLCACSLSTRTSRLRKFPIRTYSRTWKLTFNNSVFVQSYWACVGLYPSFFMWKTKDHNVSETGSVSVLRWMWQDKPTQLGPLESLRNVVVFCLPHTRRWIESKTSPIALYNIHNRQNPFKSTSICSPLNFYFICI
jgi:hypothetical protein